MDSTEYKKLWAELKLHPLQSVEWSRVYDGSELYLAGGTPTLVRFGVNPINKVEFASVYRVGHELLDADTWLKELVEQVIARHQKLSHISIEPNGQLNFKSSQLTASSLKPVNSRYTVINDLSASEEDLLSKLSKSHRQNTNKALRSGLNVEIHSSGDNPLARFQKIMDSISTSKSFLQFDEKHYRRVWTELSSANMSYISIGTYDGEDIGAYMVVYGNGTAYQFYGGRTEAGRQKRLAQGLAFKTMIAAKDFGCTKYDMWGVGKFNKENVLDPNDEKYGIGTFKAAFGGTLYQHGPTVDYIIDSKSYKKFLRGKRLRSVLTSIKKKIK